MNRILTKLFLVINLLFLSVLIFADQDPIFTDKQYSEKLVDSYWYAQEDKKGYYFQYTFDDKGQVYMYELSRDSSNISVIGYVKGQWRVKDAYLYIKWQEYSSDPIFNIDDLEHRYKFVIDSNKLIYEITGFIADD